MNIKELQEELVGKIALIPTENDKVSVERALKIVDEVKDHINDTIVFGDQRLTALDYVIIADSQGSNPKISERPRIGNRALKELEDAIRNIGGRTSEELGLVQNISYSRSEFQRAVRDFLEGTREMNLIMTGIEGSYRNSYRRTTRDIPRIFAHSALFAGSLYLVCTSGNYNDEEFSMSRYLTGIFGIGVFTMLQVPQIMNCLRELTLGQQERQPFMSLENATVQPNIEERSLS
ncbi:hypothetical protein [Wolbachia endosymbiont (group B) of Athalia cordata]|uniref:hypothetical protein n=1 Tax=Wolbachia endosymbiont (group B) of Athalia cordata TaxID=2953986 RepID=UPI0022312C7D|nr:hypothetical protein [Wolbachia endosymbiont (group B) of Athalia cordata]